MGLPLQSVPTVAAFWQGQIADLFQGAQPESEVKRFVEQLLKLAGGTMPAADLLAEAQVALDEGRAEEASELYTAIISTEPENPAAWGGLVRAMVALDEMDQAHEVLSQVPAKITNHADVAGAPQRARLGGGGSPCGVRDGCVPAPGRRQPRTTTRPRYELGHRAQRLWGARRSRRRAARDHAPGAWLE